MLAASALLSCSSGVIYPSHPKVPFSITRYTRTSFKRSNALRLASTRVPRPRIQYAKSGTICSSSIGRHHPELGFDADFSKEPFWLGLIKEVIWASKTLLVFLAEQPGQLKYIEWPSFGSTLKTATLTLLLVVAFIVALSSIDSALCYMLALLLRRTS